MSITSAFAFGFDPSSCATGCSATPLSPYFDSPSGRPWRDHRMRPAMLLAGSGVAEVRALIDRGIDSDFTYPTGTAYLARTEDQARNTRAGQFAVTAALAVRAFKVRQVQGALRYRDDVMAYFTGLASVPHLETLRFLPGAVADHLTSFGGQLTDSRQMSALAWLSAGATGSYGTVTEPCNFPQKFPHSGVFLLHYLDGDSLIEAYWKSVAWPAQGVFVGEPLARPFGARVRMGTEAWLLEAYSETPVRRYIVRTAPTAENAGRVIGTITLAAGFNRIALPPAREPVFIEAYPAELPVRR
jgi:uncharacterized protein (TIGR03790 family)